MVAVSAAAAFEGVLGAALRPFLLCLGLRLTDIAALDRGPCSPRFAMLVVTFLSWI
jgi:hypothetical protein